MGRLRGPGGDEGDAAPLPGGVTVRLRRGLLPLAETRTDEEGRFRLELPADGRRLRLEVEPPEGYLAPAGALRIEDELRRAEPGAETLEIELPLADRAVPLLRVRDGSGSPVADQAVLIEDPDGRRRLVWSDTLGRILGPKALPSGPLTLELVDHGERLTVEHRIEGGRARPIEIEARPGPRLAVDLWTGASPPRELHARLFAETGGWGRPRGSGRLVPGSPPRLAFGPLETDPPETRYVLQVESPDGHWYGSLRLTRRELEGEGPARILLTGRGRIAVEVTGADPRSPALVAAAARATPQVRAWLAGEGGEAPQAGLSMGLEPSGETLLGPLDAGLWLVWLEQGDRRGPAHLAEIEAGGRTHLALDPPR